MLELLIAMVLFAIMATLAYGGLRTVINTSSGVQRQMKRLEALQRSMLFIERDLRQLVARPMNTDSAKKRSAVELASSGKVLIEFTRGGNPNPAGLIRSSLQRVSYVLEEDELIRQTWGQVDHLQATKPVEMNLLGKVNKVKFRVLDINNKWHTSWGKDVKQFELIPVAVELTIDHKKWGVITRLIPVYGF